MSSILRRKRYCDSLFAIVEEISSMLSEERLHQRRELTGSILETLHDQVFHLNVGSRLLLENAVQYLDKYWLYLLIYLQDGCLEISNNQAA